MPDDAWWISRLEALTERWVMNLDEPEPQVHHVEELIEQAKKEIAEDSTITLRWNDSTSQFPVPVPRINPARCPHPIGRIAVVDHRTGQSQCTACGTIF